MSKNNRPGELSFLSAYMKAEEASKDPDNQRNGVQVTATSDDEAALLAEAARHYGLRVTGFLVDGKVVEEKELQISIATPRPKPRPSRPSPENS